MKTDNSRFILGFIILAMVLIVVVPVIDFFIARFMAQTESVNNSLDYANPEMLSGIAGETIRALITTYLYSTTVNKGSSLLHGIKYGLLYSALIASLYIILGGFYFQLKDPVNFIIVDSMILFVQGVLSGFVLYYSFSKRKSRH